MRGMVVAVARRAEHAPGKLPVPVIRLVEGSGVEGDAHAGATVQHRSRVAADPTRPNLRQVHLIHEEHLERLRERGFDVAPARMGENVTTRGIDLLDLPTGARLHLGTACVVVTGLRNPCVQLESVAPGLMSANLEVLGPTEAPVLRRLAGVMAVVERGGLVRPGDAIDVTLPPTPWKPLDRV